MEVVALTSESKSGIVGQPLTELLDFDELTVKADRDLLAQLNIVAFSAYTLSPLNARLVDLPGTGKTYAIVEALKKFPDGDVIYMSYASPTAFFHEVGEALAPDGSPLADAIEELYEELNEAKRSKNLTRAREIKEQIKEMKRNSYILLDLSNKILVFLDVKGFQLFENLKDKLSHDKWETEVRITDKELNVPHLRIRGWPCVIVASAATDLEMRRQFEELTQRFLDLNVTVGKDKYLQANKVSADRRGLPPEIFDDLYNQKQLNYVKGLVEEIKADILRIRQNLLWKGYKPDGGRSLVYNPYRQELATLFTLDTPETMRYFNQFLEFASVITLVNQNEREFVQVGPDPYARYPVVSIEDLELASKLLQSHLTVKLTKRARACFQQVVIPAWKIMKEATPKQSKIQDGNEKGTISEPELTPTDCLKYFKEHREKITDLPSLSKSHLTEYLQAMEARGLITLSSSQIDRRQTVITVITDKIEELVPKDIIGTKREQILEAARNDQANLAKLVPVLPVFTDRNAAHNSDNSVKGGKTGTNFQLNETNSSEIVPKSSIGTNRQTGQETKHTDDRSGPKSEDEEPLPYRCEEHHLETDSFAVFNLHLNQFHRQAGIEKEA